MGLATALVTCGTIISVPQAAFAADPFTETEMLATQSGSSDIVALDRTTGEATVVLTVPGAAKDLNQIGISGDGNIVMLTNATTIFEYTASSETWEDTPRTGETVATTMGGVDPASGLLYFGGQARGDNFTFATYDPTTNSLSSGVVSVTAADAPGGNGDIAFDSRGNLYFVSSGSQFAQLYRVDANKLGGGATVATKVGPPIDAGRALNSMAFADDGFVYIAGSGSGNGFLRVHPVTGAVLERRPLGAVITDLGTNAVPFTAAATADLSDGRFNPGDQFTITIGGGGISTGNTGTSTGTETSVTVGPLLILPGETYTIAQTPAGTTNLNNYDTVWTCIDPATGAVVATGPGNSGQFTVPAGVKDVACTFTSTPKPAPVADDDELTDNKQGQPVTVNVVGNDLGDLDPTSVTIIGGAGGPVTELVVPGEGTWRVNRTTGAITFTPAAGFSGNPTPISYEISDIRGNTTAGGVTVTFAPEAADDESMNNAQGKPVIVDVVGNDLGALDPTTVSILDGAGDPVTELVVPGEGAWTVDPATGAVTFTPEVGFIGNPTRISYEISDTRGTTTTGDVTVTFAPEAADDESLNNPQGAPVTVNVIGNDAGDLDPKSVNIVDRAGDPVAELVIKGEGTWTVSAVTGAITFTPEAGFSGNPTPISYEISDRRGNTTTAIVTVAFVPEAADDESLNNAQGKPVIVNVIGNDAGDLNPVTVTILDDAGAPVTELVVPGEGTWTVDPATRAITFAPEAGFSGNPTPISYGISDTRGNTTTADVTVAFVPEAADDESLNNAQGRPVIVNVIGNDLGDLDPTTVNILDGAGDPVTTLAVKGEGSWTVDPATGAITFAPKTGFTGNPTPISYEITDTRGNTTTADVEVTFLPEAPDDESLNNQQGEPVTIHVIGNDAGDLDPATVNILDGAGDPVTTLTVTGEGIWTVNRASGAITFTPEDGFTGNPTPIRYEVSDRRGNTTTGDVTVTFAPVAADDESPDNAQGKPVTVDVVGNDLGDLDPTTVTIDGAGGPVTELAVPGEGTWTVDPASGAITFTPATGFSGNPTPISYTVSDSIGSVTAADVVVTYVPGATADESLHNAQGKPVLIDVIGNDLGDLDPTTVSILDGAGDPVTKLVVKGEGTWVVDAATGAITFTPEAGFSGNPAPISYEISDTRGNTTTADVTVAFVPAAADDESLDNAQGTPVIVDVAGNDLGDLDPTTVSVLDDAGAPVTELVVPGEGTWTVDPASGAITFTPEAGFTGNPTPISYAITDTRGNTTTADVTVAFAPVVPVPPVADDGDPAPVAAPATSLNLASAGVDVFGAATAGLVMALLGMVLVVLRRRHPQRG